MRSISAVLTDLYTRWARRPFSASTLWEIEQTDTSLIKTQLRTHTPFAIALLRVMPWSIDFYERLKLFREVVDGERVSIQGVLHDSNDPSRSKGGPTLSLPLSGLHLPILSITPNESYPIPNVLLWFLIKLFFIHYLKYTILSTASFSDRCYGSCPSITYLI